MTFLDCVALLRGFGGLWIEDVLDPFLSFVVSLGGTFLGFVVARGGAFFGFIRDLRRAFPGGIVGLGCALFYRVSGIFRSILRVLAGLVSVLAGGALGDKC